MHSHSKAALRLPFLYVALYFKEKSIIPQRVLGWKSDIHLNLQKEREREKERVRDYFEIQTAVHLR